MIKVSATICGTIVRDAVITTNEKNVSNLEFTLRIALPSRSNDGKTIDVPVVVSGGKREDIKDYVRGNRIVMEGNLVITKADDILVFILRDAKPQVTYSVPSTDYVKGDLAFTGRVKECSEKLDKRGLPYFILTASSPVKLNDNKWERIWFHFKRFPKKGEDIKAIIPTNLVSGVDVEILGDIEISTFNGRVNLSSHIMELAVKDAKDSESEEVKPF